MIQSRFKMGGKSKSLTIYIRRIVIFSTLLTTIVVAAFVGVHEFLIFKQISKQQLDTHLSEHKEFVRDLINIEVNYIAGQKKMFDERTILSVKENVCHAASIAEEIYSTYKDQFDEETIKKLIIDVVSSLKCDNPYMHVFINELNGTGVYYPGNPQYQGKNLFQLTDVNGNQVVRTEIEFLKTQDDGYVRYVDGNHLTDRDLPVNKVVFVKKFNPLNWYFGSKTYLEDYYDEFKNEVASKISADYFRYGGYVFINEVNGDPIVMDGKVYDGDFNMLDGSDSAKMAVFNQQLDVAMSSPDGGYFTYEWNKIGKEQKVPKISFVKSFDACNWLVGAGFYLDEIWPEIHEQQQQLKAGLIKNLIIIFLVLLLVILIESLVIFRLTSNYMDDFHNFAHFFKAGKERYQTIDVDNLYFEEFKNIGEVANEMISERKKVHKQLVLEQEKAKDADRLKTAFLANMSHEIRTPMNAILGFSSLLDDEELNERDKKIYVELIQKNGEFLLKLINDIIDISKIESDQLSIVKEKFLLVELLDEIALYRKEHIASNVNTNIKFEMENNLPSDYLCHTDSLRLKQVLDNLIGNAMKFTHEGSVKLTVSKRGEWLHFNVKDSGIGISEEDVDYIFKRFIQARKHSKKTYGGTGLGLAISQKIIHLMGGDIGVKSKLGKGSEFYFYIPS